MLAVAGHIVLTGEPGVGKTTLIQKVCEAIKSKGIPVTGFYTSERRLKGERKGFDVVTLDGQSASLASIEDQPGSSAKGKPRVGRYVVEISEFESLALPALNFSKERGEASKLLVVVDEIGKMELFSKKFEFLIKELFAKRGNYTILATIPSAKRQSISLVEEIRKSPDVQLFEITRSNRNPLCGEVMQAVEMRLQ